MDYEPYENCRVIQKNIDSLGNPEMIEIVCPITPKMRQEIGYPLSQKEIVLEVHPVQSVDVRQVK